MDIDVFDPTELNTVFRVLRRALSPADTLDARERAFIDTYARITGHAVSPADLEPIAPDAVHIADAHPRKRLLQLAAIATLLSQPVRPASLEFLKALAHQLATHDPVIEVIAALNRGQHRKVRLLAMRRAMRVMFKEAWLGEGAWGVLRLFGAMALQAAVNKDKLWQYKRLGMLPEGSLGREYFKHMVGNGFPFPGEPAGIADSVTYHDVLHVLAGHEATPMGEIQQGSFQGGNRREDGFFFIQFVLLQFHQGVKVTPATEGQFGHFDPVKVLWAIHRGSQCPIDMTHQWNFWPLMGLPLGEARAQCGLLPHWPAAA